MPCGSTGTRAYQPRLALTLYSKARIMAETYSSELQETSVADRITLQADCVQNCRVACQEAFAVNQIGQFENENNEHGHQSSISTGRQGKRYFWQPIDRSRMRVLPVNSMVNVLSNTVDRHHTARPWGRGMKCVVGVETLDLYFVLVIQWCTHHHVI